MTNNNNSINQCDIGMVGLGTMGRNVLLNMAEHGFTVAGYNDSQDKLDRLRDDAKAQHRPNIFGATTLEEFLNLLKTPRVVILLVPAGKAVDDVINEMTPHLQAGDLIIDAGNSHFTDTNVRLQQLQKKGIQFLGVGISGGEAGARHGASIMPGGPKAAYEHVRPILEAVAAKVNGEPCVTYLGTGSVGHFVKMVHNGIEYGLMQMIAETYDVMKRGLGMSNEQLHNVYRAWNDSPLNSYLLEITSRIFSKNDEKTQHGLIDVIAAVAKQNGTGMWTSQIAMELQVPTTIIDAAVSMRDLSAFVSEREQAQDLYNSSTALFQVDQSTCLKQLQSAFFSGMMTVYAQGMAVLAAASEKYTYLLDLEAVARIWRGGCIIRAHLLEDIAEAYRITPQLSNLLLDPTMAKKILENQEGLRHIVSHASMAGIPVPGLMAALGYLEAYRSKWLPANLVQAQRDYFGAHTYERIDVKGTFHTEWEKDTV